MKTSLKLRMLGIAPIAAASIIGGAALVHAQTAPSDSTTPAVTTTMSGQAETAATTADTYITKLAANLGISEDTLRAAIKTTSLTEVADAQASGKLTQAQADELRTKINSGEAGLFGFMGGGPRGMGPGGHGGPGGGPAESADLAAFLGIDEATLHSELGAGATLAQEASAHGKTRDELKAFLEDAFNAKVDAKVADGSLTADKAATRKAEYLTKVDEQIDSTRPAGGPGGHHGPRPADSDSAAPSPTTAG